MQPPHHEPHHRTFIGTVVFVDIVEYSKGLVSQQVELKTRLNEMIGQVLEHVPAGDRTMVDTGDGAALCFLGDPEDALFVASSLRAAAVGAGPDFALRIGINTGPLRVVQGMNNQPNFLGDAINVAQRVMTFAEPNQILVSRSYYEIVSRLSQEYAQLFQYAGLHKDKHVREHEVYAVAGGPAARTSTPAPPGPPLPPGAGTVVGSEFVAPATAPAAGRFEPAVLAPLEGALVQCMGPVARVIVRRAAAAAPNLRALCHALGESVPESERPQFTKRIEDLAAHLGPAACPAGAEIAPRAEAVLPAADKPGRPLSPELLAEAAERLAVYIGPMAKVLVRKTAETAGGTRELYERLARHIDDPRDRQRFVAAAEPGEP